MCYSDSAICKDDTVYQGPIAQLDSKGTRKCRVSMTYPSRHLLPRDTILTSKLCFFLYT